MDFRTPTGGFLCLLPTTSVMYTAKETDSVPGLQIPTSAFLCLLPTTSDSPPAKKIRAPAPPHLMLPGLDADGLPSRRESSASTSSDGVSSTASSAFGHRYLKLSPVHFGAHLDGNQLDWCDADE